MKFCVAAPSSGLKLSSRGLGIPWLLRPNGVTLQPTHCGLKSSHLCAPFPEVPPCLELGAKS